MDLEDRSLLWPAVDETDDSNVVLRVTVYVVLAQVVTVEVETDSDPVVLTSELADHDVT